jgi:hypothetical protein
MIKRRFPSVIEGETNGQTSKRASQKEPIRVLSLACCAVRAEVAALPPPPPLAAIAALGAKVRLIKPGRHSSVQVQFAAAVGAKKKNELIRRDQLKLLVEEQSISAAAAPSQSAIITFALRLLIAIAQSYYSAVSSQRSAGSRNRFQRTSA